MDVVANIHFGFVGAASGFGLEELLVGAGVAQIWDGTSDWSYWNSNFDQPKDQYGIWLGFLLYQQYGANLTEADFNAAIEEHGDNLNQPQ